MRRGVESHSMVLKTFIYMIHIKQKVAGDKTTKGFGNAAYSRVCDRVLRVSGNITATARRWTYEDIATAMVRPADYTVGCFHGQIYGWIDRQTDRDCKLKSLIRD